MRRTNTLFALLAWCICAMGQSVHNIRGAWEGIADKGAPWVRNVSRPNKITSGLDGRHLSLWASHGRYYDQKKGYWRWQRPNLFCTTEDLFTQTIVVPYLIPMLENAGACVFTPRERDWQPRECIVDNDFSHPGGTLTVLPRSVGEQEVRGFGMHEGNYRDGESPFGAGSAIAVKTAKARHATFFRFTPEITEEGAYAVYVTYPKLDNAVDDAHYTVHHKGMETEFVVNQRIGYGTWVYLGTFEFGKTNPKTANDDNCVVISTESKHKGMIGVDAVRFGGGMGNISRSGTTSGFARCLEGARYYAQWAGAPYSVYSGKNGTDDYSDDINVRSTMTNWVGGGSCFMPTTDGLGVPIELSLALHSDASYHPDGKTIYGSLAIATTDFNDGLLSSGVPRRASLELASRLLNNLQTDMTLGFGEWNKRYLWDRNYSETRLPEVPSAIIETLSHESFPDMMVGQHPYGKFAIARSIYKTILRYVCEMHGKKPVVQPLAPTDFRVELAGGNKIHLQWAGVADSREPTAMPTSYNIYTAVNGRGYDNGQNVRSTSATMRLTPGARYDFRITACNDGGESFPTETLSAYIAPDADATILVVNGFRRLSAPQVVDNGTQLGFDINADEGVQRGIYPGWAGSQTTFDKRLMGAGLGDSGSELEGVFVAGNEFNYVADHTAAIMTCGRYSVASCSLKALEKELVDLTPYALVDLAFGLQKDDHQLGLSFKTFTPSLRKQLEAFALRGGALLASGSFLGSDMQSKDEREFMQRVLKVAYTPTPGLTANATISGLGMQFDIYRTPNSRHYAATHPQVLEPTAGAICAMQYADGTSAGVGYKGRHSAFTTGFPIECITDDSKRAAIVRGVVAYLLQR